MPEMPPLFGLAPGGVCRAASVTVRAVRSYRTLSPLPGPKARRFAFCGTFPGVAPAGRYPAPCFRGARTFLCTNAAAIRPSDPLDMSAKRARVKVLAHRTPNTDIAQIRKLSTGRKNMKAAVYYENGPPSVFKYEDVEDPACLPEGIVIKVEAVSIEGGDTLNRARGDLVTVPHVVGYQAAGTIIEVGADVKK